MIKKAFEISRERGKGAPADGKKRVTCIVKHNVLHGCRLFLEVFREVGAQFPDVEQDVAIVDAFAMFVLTQPERYGGLPANPQIPPTYTVWKRVAKPLGLALALLAAPAAFLHYLMEGPQSEQPPSRQDP